MRGLALADPAMVGATRLPMLRQSAGGRATSPGGTTATATANLPSVALPGSLLVCVASIQSSVAFSGGAMTLPAGFSAARATQTDPALSCQVQICDILNAAGTEQVISVTETFTNALWLAIEVMEFTAGGLGTAWALDTTGLSANPAGTATSLAAGSTGALATGHDVAIGAVGLGNNTTAPSWNAGLNVSVHGNGTNDIVIAGQLVSPPAAGVAPTASWTNAVTRAGAVASYKRT